MQTPIFDATLRQLAIASISGYQKHISPKKGFACGHRVLYGGESCSQYIKSSIGQFGFFEAVKKSRRRFAACKQANEILKSRFNSQSVGENPSWEGKKLSQSVGGNYRRSSKCQNDCANGIA
ncbi:MAG: membrane protein insertion efficiency factor YidD [Microcoleus sp.]